MGSVGAGVTGGSVAVTVGLGLGACVGVAVRGAGVTETVGDGLGEGEGDGEGLADGAANCCEEITAAPRSKSATRARAANTLKTVDQRSAGRRASGTGAGGATLAWAGGGVICSVSSRAGSLLSRFVDLSSTRWHNRIPHAERSDGRTVARLGVRALLLVSLLAACGGYAGSGRGALDGTVDCGSFDAGHDEYDQAGVDCVWSAYTAQRGLMWRVTSVTIEGDPVPATLSFEPGKAIVVTRDLSADKFTAPGSRRIFTYTCGTMTRTTWPTDPSRYYFALSACTGDGPETVFP